MERAVTGGAKVPSPAQNQFCGDRVGWVIVDPSGHVWTIATRVEEPSEDQRRERWSNILSGSSPAAE
jgi:PhnB protein